MAPLVASFLVLRDMKKLNFVIELVASSDLDERTTTILAAFVFDLTANREGNVEAKVRDTRVMLILDDTAGSDHAVVAKNDLTGDIETSITILLLFAMQRGFGVRINLIESFTLRKASSLWLIALFTGCLIGTKLFCR
jgi:hypothetical protein